MAEGGRLRTLWNNYNTKEIESNKKRQRPGSNDDLSCAKCDKDVDHRDLSCSGCKLLYCEQCTGLSKSVYACVRAGELGEFLWSCKSCKNTLPTLENINSTLKEIQSSNVTRFKNIEDRLQIVEKNSGQEFINNIKKDVTNEIRVDISTVVNDQLKEYEDIRKRELNIIMFNVPEKMDTNGNIRQREDLEDINSISTSLGLTDELEVTAQFRLGKTKMNAIRPLKVILKNKSQRKFLLENARFISTKAERKLSKVVILKDLTPKQQGERKDKIKKKKGKALEKELVNEDDYVDNIEAMEQLSPITSELEHLNTNITSGEQTLFSQSTIVGDVGDETVMGGIQDHEAEIATHEPPTSPTVRRE